MTWRTPPLCKGELGTRFSEAPPEPRRSRSCRESPYLARLLLLLQRTRCGVSERSGHENLKSTSGLRGGLHRSDARVGALQYGGPRVHGGAAPRRSAVGSASALRLRRSPSRPHVVRAAPSHPAPGAARR